MGPLRKRRKISSQISEANGNGEISVNLEVIEERLRRIKSETFPCSNCTARFKQRHHLKCHLKRCIKKANMGCVPEENGIQKTTTVTSNKRTRNGSVKNGKIAIIIENGPVEKNKKVKNKDKPLKIVPENSDSKRPRNNQKTRLKRSLKKDKVRDTNDDQLQSNDCSYSTSFQGNLIQHKRKHSGERSFHCNDCSYSTNIRANLSQHVRKHSDERPFKCELCPSAFRFIPNLIQHRKIHTGEKSYRCDVCNFGAYVLRALMIHMKGHEEKKQFECTICPYWSSSSFLIRQHEIKHHADQEKINSVSKMTKIKTKDSRLDELSKEDIIPILNRSRNLVQKKRRKCQYVKSKLFNFHEFKIDLEFVENNFRKCDLKLRKLPNVLISGEANLRDKYSF